MTDRKVLKPAVRQTTTRHSPDQQPGTQVPRHYHTRQKPDVPMQCTLLRCLTAQKQAHGSATWENAHQTRETWVYEFVLNGRPMTRQSKNNNNFSPFCLVRNWESKKDSTFLTGFLRGLGTKQLFTLPAWYNWRPLFRFGFGFSQLRNICDRSTKLSTACVQTGIRTDDWSDSVLSEPNNIRKKF